MIRRKGTGGQLRLPGTEEDKQLIQGYAQQYAKDISDLLVK